MKHFSTSSLVALLLTIAAVVVNAATITNIEPRSGSLLGQTRLTITGTGFDIRGRSNDVFIGEGTKGTFCDPVPNECTPTRILCLTEAPGQGVQPVSVRSFGFLADCQVSGGCTFEYTATKTPEVASISPEWISWTPQPLTVTGSKFTLGDPTVGFFDFTLHVGEEERCELLGEGISSSSFQCNIHSMRPGTLPLNLIHGASGKAKFIGTSSLLVLPMISGVSPAEGSVRGGTLVTITGNSFSNVLIENEVRIHNALCPVTLYAPTFIVCRTSANVQGPTSVGATNTWQYGKVQQEFWYNLPGGYITQDWYNKVEYLAPQEEIMTSSVTSIARTCENCAVRTTFYFYAPEAGQYQFTGAFDDNGEFWLSEDETPVDRRKEELKLVEVDVDPFNTRRLLSSTCCSTVESKNVTLTQGWHWARIYLKQAGGGIMQNLAVTYPNRTKKDFSDIMFHIAFRAPYTPPVSVRVRGVSAVFDAPCWVQGACRFDYTAAKTAVVTGVTPSTGIVGGQTITISGTNFDIAVSAPASLPLSCDNATRCGGGACGGCDQTRCGLFSSRCTWNSASSTCELQASQQATCQTWSRNIVTVCGKPCYVSAQSATSLECSVGYGVPAGKCQVEVQVANNGRAVSAAEISSTPMIEAINPSAGGPETGGVAITVFGQGFDPTPGATSVAINGAACEIVGQVMFYRLVCITPPGTGTQNVIVTVRGQIRSTVFDIVAFNGNYARPGITQANVPVSITPVNSGLRGVDRLVIACPGKTFPADAKITVTFGTANTAPVLSTAGESIVVQSPQLDSPRKLAATVVIKNNAETETLHTFTTPEVNFNSVVTSATEWLNPTTSNRVWIYGDFQPARNLDVQVAIQGQPCKNVDFDPYYQSITCDAQPKPTSMPPLPKIATYDFTPSGFSSVISAFFHSDKIQQNADATITIPAGQYVMTKQSFTRPFAFEAQVRPSTSVEAAGNNAAIYMRFGFEDATSNSGYIASVGNSASGFFGIGRDWARPGPNKEYVGAFAGVGVNPSTTLTLRVEAGNEFISFYVNGVLADRIQDRAYLTGKIGFGMSRQLFTLGSINVYDLYPQSLQVNVSGVPMRSNADALYLTTPVYPSSMPNRNFKAGSEVIIYLDTWVSSPRVYALRSETEQVSRHTPLLCTGGLSRTETGAIKFTCSASSLAAGSYFWLLVSSSHGTSSRSFPGTYAVSLSGVNPKIATTTIGAVITVSGAGFTSASNVKIGSTDCVTMWQNERNIACKVTGAIPSGNHAVTVVTGANTAASCGTDCTVAATAPVDTPSITSVDNAAGALPRAITINGANFNSGVSAWIGNNECDVWSRTTTRIVVYCKTAAAGNQELLIRHNNINGVTTATFNVQAGATTVEPSEGSINGGAEITLKANALPSGSTTGKLGGRDFNNQGIETAGWTGAAVPATLFYCNGESLFGMNMQYSLSRSFTGVAAHGAIKVSYKLHWKDWQRFYIMVDDVKYTVPFTRRYTGSCMQSSGSDSFIAEGFVIVPHTASTVTVTFGNGGSSLYWGLSSYSIDTVASIPHTVSVGGSNCVVTLVSDQSVTCKPAPAVAAATVAVSLQVAGAEHCHGCQYTTSSAKTPVVTHAFASNPAGVSNTDTQVPQFAVHSNIQVTYANNKAALKKTAGGNSWWNGWFFSPFALKSTDGDVVGVTATLTGRWSMIGLTSTLITDTDHAAIEYNLYYENGRLYAYRSGAYVTTLDLAANGDVVQVAYHRDCGCIRASYRPRGVKVPRVIFTWETTPTFPLYVAGVLHADGESGFKDVQLITPRAQTERVVFFGSNFRNHNAYSVPDVATAITIGGTPCVDSFVSNGVASCWVAPATAAAASFANVRIGSVEGFSTPATITRSAFTVSPPSITAGSTAGGHQISFTGSGFTAATTVTIAGQACIITSYTATNIQCSTSARSAITEAAVVVETSGNTHVCIGFTDIHRAYSAAAVPSCIYSYADASTPAITSAPATASVGASYIIDGTSFITTQKPRVYFGPGMTSMCEVTAYSATQVTCTVPATVAAGTYTVSLSWASVGQASNSPSGVSVDLSVTGLSPASSGNLGGATIELTGAGFGKTATTSDVVSVKVGGADLCSSITRDTSKLTCVTNAGAFSGPIDVTINGKTASSAAFTAAGGNLAVISSFAPTMGGKGTFIALSGSNLAEVTQVLIGTSKCQVFTTASNLVTCVVVDSVTSAQTITVVSSTRGLSAASASSFTAAASIDASSNYLSSPVGKPDNTYSVEIKGDNIGVATEIVAEVGSRKCLKDKTASTDGKFTCEFVADANAPTTNDVIAAIFTGSNTNSAGFTYTYSNLAVPTVDSIAPTMGSAAGMEYITVTGSGFPTDPNTMSVRIGSAPCYVTEATSATSFICQTSEMPIQDGLAFNLIIDGMGRASTSATFNSRLNIDSVSSTDVSVEGGLELTITGTGFWPIADSQDWRYQRAILKIGGRVCPIKSSTSTQLKCTLPATQITPHTRNPSLLSAYVLPPEELSRSITYMLNSVSATVAPAAVINYKHTATPRVTSVTGSATVTIAGSGFAAIGNVVDYAGTGCTVVAESTTQVTCTPVGGYYTEGAAVRVKVPGKGYSAGQLSCAGGQYLTCDGTCLSDANCVYAEWGVTTCVDLAKLIMTDSFCHSNGGTDRVGLPFRSDDGTKINFNCPLYSCEGGDCDNYLSIGGIGARFSTCGPNPSGPMVKLAPSISSLSHTQSSVNGGLLLTITGNNFNTNASRITISIGGALCTVTSATDTSVVCRTGAAAAAYSNAPVYFYVDRVLASGTLPTLNFISSASWTPVISSITPSTFSAGDVVTVAGTGFTTSSTVLFGNKFCSGPNADATQITCTVPDQSTPGTIGLRVDVPGKGYSNTVNGVMRLRVLSLSPSVGSTEGGTLVTLVGSAFSQNTRVTFGTCPTEFVSFTAASSSIVVRTGACAAGAQNANPVDGSVVGSNCGNACRLTFAAASTPNVASASFGAGTATLTTSNIASAPTPSDVTVSFAGVDCVVSVTGTTSTTCAYSNPVAGTYKVMFRLNNLGYATTTAQFISAHSITGVNPTSGSLGGGQRVTITGTGFSSNNDHNKVTIGLNGPVCTPVSSSNTEIVCVTTAVASPVADTIRVAIADPAAVSPPTVAISAATYSYDANLSPTVTSINPSRGSTAGGTILTITGTKLDTVGLTVSIDGVNCPIEGTATATEYRCKTASHTTLLAPVVVKVATPSNGDAINKETYQYVDLWSRYTTWGNTPPPVRGDSVVIGEGTTVMVDYSPPRFYLVIVMGHLIFDWEKDIDFDCTYIMINFGRMTVGTPEKPYLKKATITLYGDRLTPEIPVHGSKVLALRHGALDMHGIKRQPTWTRLAATAVANTNTINVRGPVDWKAGEFIFIASTDFHHEHTEHRMITGVEPADGQAANVKLTLEYPLKWEHYGVQQCMDPANTAKPLCIDEIAEVGLLSRNIVVQGDRNSMNIGFGGTLFLMPLGENKDRYARLSYVEFRQVGQQFIVGRYPVHFHVTHEASNSYCNGTAVHQSLNRAFSIHGVMNNTYVNNVAYDIQGHAFFIEDGSEKWNVIDNNFVAHVHVSTSNLNTDLTPANFWIVSASNKITNNAAGGGDAYGYWISPFHPHSTGPTHSTSICPHHHKLWEFHSNVAHSNHKYGFNIFKYWFPKEVECDPNSPDALAVLHNLVSYKNQIWGITYGNHDQGEVGAITFERVISADNGLEHRDGAAFWIEVVKARNMTNGVRDSVMIAKTNNQPNTRTHNRRGINLAKGDNFFVENVTFVNYVDSMDHGFEPQAWAERMSLCFPYGWEAVTSKISWVNSPNRILYRFHHHGIINDVDGTVTGSPASQVLTKSPIMDNTICADATISTNIPSLVCPESYKVRRFGPDGISEIWQPQIWNIENRQEIVPVITRNYIMTAPVQRMTTVSFQAVKVPDTWTWHFSGPTFTKPGEKFMFWVQHNETRNRVYASFDGVLDKNFTRAPPTLADTKSAFSFNANTSIFQGLIVYPTRSMRVSSFNCPEAGCPLPPLPPGSWDTPCRPYNLGSSWVSGQVPVTDLNTDLHIVNEESVCLGAGFTGTCDANTVMTYEYRLLRVEGSIQFRDEHCPCDGATVHVKVGAMWIRQGGLLVGNAEQKLTRCNFRLSIMEPDWFNPESVRPVTVRPWGARSLILESGMLMLNGQLPTPHMARLSVTAPAGAQSITVDRDLGSWKVGDWIYIAGTNRRTMYTKFRQGDDAVAMGENQRERRRIVAISVDKRTVTLDSPLRHAHFGTAGATIDGTPYQIGAEVVIMNRNIVVDGGKGTINDIAPFPAVRGGWVLNAGCTPDNYEGCAVYPDAGWPMSADKPGYIRIEGAWMRDAGQGGILNGAGVHFDGLLSTIPDASYSFFRHNVLERFFHTGVMIRHTTTGLKVENNVIIDPEGDGIAVIGTNNFINGNVMIGSGIPYSCDLLYHIFPECRAAGIRVHGSNVVENNIVAGFLTVGILTDGDSCDKELSFSNNYLHSNRDGLLIYDGLLDANMNYPTREDLGVCRRVGGVISYWNGDHGITAWYSTGSISIENSVVVENTIGIASLLSARSSLPTLATSTATYKNLVVAGYFDGMTCRSADHHWKCIHSLVDSSDWCERFLHNNGGHKKIGVAGILETVFVSPELGIGRTKGEKKFRWEESDSYATMIGQAVHDGITFANFDGADSCGLRNVAFHNNIFSNDTFKHHIFRNIKWAGTVQNGGEYWATRLYGPAPMITSERQQTWWLDYDDTKFGAFFPDAPNQNLIIDADGTFTKRGAKSSIVAGESVVRPTKFDTYKYHGRAFQAGSLDPASAGCTWKPEWNAHMCDQTHEWSSFTIDSLAEDALTRRPGPVVLCNGDGMIDINGHPLCQGGHVQFASGPVMKGKVQRATLDRLTRYKFHVKDRGNYTLAFRGSPPVWMRMILHDTEHTAAANNAGITVNLRFHGLNSQLRQIVYVNGVRQKPNVGFGFPWTYGQTWPGPRDAIGTHFHNKLIMDRGTDKDGLDQTQYNVLYFTVRPGSVIEIKAEEVVQLNMDISIPLESFFNEKDNFVVALATQLNIDASRLKFANIVPGGTLSANTLGFAGRRAGSALAATTNATTVILSVAKRDGDGQQSYDAGVSINDFDQIVLKSKTLSTFGAYSVSNVQAEVLPVNYPQTPVNIKEGQPYIVCNASKLAIAGSTTAVDGKEQINATQMQEYMAKWFVKTFPAEIPYNTSTLDEMGVSNVWFNKATGWSRVVFNLGYYENNLAVRYGLDKMNPLLGSNATAVSIFPEHRFYGCGLVNNGWTDSSTVAASDSNAALVFGLAIGLSLFFLILIGCGVAYYYFVVRPRNAAKKVEKGVSEYELEEAGEWDPETHPADQYDELGRPYFYDEEGQPYYYDEEGRAHYYYDTHDSEAPMYDELGRQYFYDEQGQPYFLDEAGKPQYYYNETKTA